MPEKQLYLLRKEEKDESSYQELTEEEAKNLIPHGEYCYTWTETPSAENNFCGKVKVCPFWQSFYPKLPEQSCGFCHFLKVGDFTENGTFLLWDQIKYCGINFPEEKQ